MPLDGKYRHEQNESRLFRIREDHLPGDLGFYPLGLKPTNDKDLVHGHPSSLLPS